MSHDHYAPRDTREYPPRDTHERRDQYAGPDPWRAPGPPRRPGPNEPAQFGPLAEKGGGSSSRQRTPVNAGPVRAWRSAPVTMAVIAAVAIIIGGTAVILFGVRDSGIGTGDAAAATVTTVSAGAAAATFPGTGTTVTDGDLEFVVQAVTCGSRRAGTATAGKTAQGQFCFVKIMVRNTGRVSRTFDPAVQKAYATDGAAFAADGEAGLYANGAGAALTGSLAPGARTSGVVLFDIPLGAGLAELDLHDSAFSAGVRVRVG